MKIAKISTPPRKRATPSSKNMKKPWIKFAIMTLLVILMGFLCKYVLEQTIFYNPLLGTWRAQTILGIREIAFERGSMTSFGTKSAVSYDIQEGHVIVMDPSLQLGNKYTIVDKNTISFQIGSAKTVYKRVP